MSANGDEELDLGDIDPGVLAGYPRPAQPGAHPWAPSEFDHRELVHHKKENK